MSQIRHCVPYAMCRMQAGPTHPSLTDLPKDRVVVRTRELANGTYEVRQMSLSLSLHARCLPSGSLSVSVSQSAVRSKS